MRRSALVLGFAVALLIGVAPPAGAVSGFADLPYLTITPQRLALSTDANWSGARRIIPYPFGRPPPLDDSDFAGSNRDFIWSRNCGRSVQTRAFSRDILVPGVPSRGSFYFSYAPSRERPYAGARLLVNGVTVARLPKTAGKGRRRSGIRAGLMSDRVRNAFRYGNNTIEIEATKTKLRRGRRCQDRKRGRNVGVLADIELGFESTLFVNPPTVSPEVVRNVVDGQAVGVAGAAVVTNKGPSASITGELKLSVQGAATQHTIGNVPDGCTVTSSTAGLIFAEMRCRYEDFPAGSSRPFHFNAASRVTTANFSQGSGRILVYVRAAPGSGSNTFSEQTKVIILCQAGATSPDCN